MSSSIRDGEVFPVTSSTLSEGALGSFIKEQYQLIKNVTCKLFRTGINHTYFISTDDEKFVARVYSHNWRSESEIVEELAVLSLLKEHNLSVSFPIDDKNGKFIQQIDAPEGYRYLVLFSFAEGAKTRFMDSETCFATGLLMANFHELLLNKSIGRTTYNKKSLTESPYNHLVQFFSEKTAEMEFVKEFGKCFQNSDFEGIRKGVVHMDIWYDNMAVTNDGRITVFDFDFCGNGWLVLDIAYFANQLFFIETDRDLYESKLQIFLNGYQKITPLPPKEIKLIPRAGAAVFVFYLGVQAQRFDWSNIFLTENYLKMFVGRIKSWLEYHKASEMV